MLQFCSTLCEPVNCSLPSSLSVGFLRQEYWSGFPFPSLEDLPDLGIEPPSPASPAFQVDSLPLSHSASLIALTKRRQFIMSTRLLLCGSQLTFPQTPCFCCCCEVTSVVSNSVRPLRRQPTRLPRPWDSPGKNTGVGCHCLLQCMKMKSESEVAQSCPTLRDPVDSSPPGSSVHGILHARVLEWGAIAFSTRHPSTYLMDI